MPKGFLPVSGKSGSSYCRFMSPYWRYLYFCPDLKPATMIQQEFAKNVIKIVQADPGVIGLAAAGSFISGQLDEFSDLDLVLVTRDRVGDSKEKMMRYAKSFGELISGFTGEHVGEPRLLICLYDNPLLHVDIKFLVLDEFRDRVENPIILFERDKALSDVLESTVANWPLPDYQWIEDRFWTWVHYLVGKLERGELFECIDGLSFLRARVLAPMLQMKKNNLPRGLRKLEMELPSDDLENLKQTVPVYNRNSIEQALIASIEMYKRLRPQLFGKDITLQSKAELKSMEYVDQYISRGAR